ncbi:MAG: chromate efflux transporter [Anaerolineae bacterium]|nr:chromate efflux transporter [Anaerolineae bacterium]
MEICKGAALTASAPRLLELAGIFLRLGVTAFGGPAAHIGMFHDEFVKRRGWLTDEHFLDLLGASNLIPGPSSTEMTMHIGYVRAGWRGLLVAGASFILPAAAIVIVLGWLYQSYGTTPAVDGLLYGIKPVVIAVIGQAIWSLGRKAFKSGLLAGVGVAVLVLNLLGLNEIALLLGAAVFGMLVHNLRRVPTAAIFWLPLAQIIPVTLNELFLTFLKIGAVIYGSGYVLLAFLRTDFIERLGWLTDRQLLDAVAIGQFTPGPLFTTATFIGYELLGVPGAIVATLGIFLPGFILVLITNPFIPRLRESRWTAALLDGVNAAAIGLMAAVTLEIARAALIDPLTIALTLIAGVLLIRYRVNSTWLILGGGVIGLAARLLGG